MIKSDANFKSKIRSNITGRYPNRDIASYLIKVAHANVDARTKSGATALHGAALQGNHGNYLLNV